MVACKTLVHALISSQLDGSINLLYGLSTNIAGISVESTQSYVLVK